MALRPYVKRFVDGDWPCGAINTNGRFIRAGLMNIGIACHQATFMWLYQAAHDGRLPTLNQIADNQTFADALARHGNRSRVTETSPPLEGDVLIFTDAGEDIASHSCICYRGGADGSIAGYNQQSWFSGAAPAFDNDFSLYPVKNIKWVDRAKVFTKRRALYAGREMYIWAIREATAVGLMRVKYPD